MSPPESYSVFPKIGLLTIAIGDLYINYWENLVNSFLSTSGLAESCVIHVFTDQPELVSVVAQSNQKANFRIYEIASRAWPFATLDRFEIFEDHLSALREDVLLYLDADMEVVAPLPAHVFQEVIGDGIYLVEHPGYSRPKKHLARLALYAAQWRLFFPDVKAFLLHGAIGEWENRRQSSSFTPRRKRKSYVCGGCWIAEREKAYDLITTIAKKTRADKESGIIARWHDESHLNFFQSERSFPTLPPSWCFVKGYRHLSDYHPLILAVEKGDLRVR